MSAQATDNVGEYLHDMLIRYKLTPQRRVFNILPIRKYLCKLVNG